MFYKRVIKSKNDFSSKNSRGEMTTQQIVLMIILIASFAVLLFLLFRLNIGEESDSEICHNSIVMRGNSFVGNSVPLDCQTKYLCITKDGSCEGLTSPVIEKVKTQEEVYKILAEDLANCWWMYGEGKVDYVQDTTRKKLFCAKCSQIQFDNSLTDLEEFKDGKLNLTDFYLYMSNKDISSSQTYNQYLFGTNSLDEISKGADFGEITFDDQYYTLTGMHSDISTIGWVLRGVVAGGLVVVTLATAGVGTATLAIVGAGEVAGGLLGAAGKNLYVANFEEGDSGNDFMKPTLIKAKSEEFNAMDCDYAISKS